MRCEAKHYEDLMKKGKKRLAFVSEENRASETKRF